MQTKDHNEIIAKIATAMFKPYGIKRKGRSRTFLDDHGWYTIIIEFQPSSWSKGTYLNIGINFHWYLKNYFSFDIGDRENEFVDFVNEEQFTERVNKLCEKSIQKIIEYRNNMRNIKTAEKLIFNHTFTSDDLWGDYHRGIISGLIGNMNRMNKCFNKLLTVNDNTEWIIELKQNIKELIEISNNKENKFKETIIDLIKETRKAKRLIEMEIIID